MFWERVFWVAVVLLTLLALSSAGAYLEREESANDVEITE